MSSFRQEPSSWGPPITVRMPSFVEVHSCRCESCGVDVPVPPDGAVRQAAETRSIGFAEPLTDRFEVRLPADCSDGHMLPDGEVLFRVTIDESDGREFDRETYAFCLLCGERVVIPIQGGLSVRGRIDPATVDVRPLEQP